MVQEPASGKLVSKKPCPTLFKFHAQTIHRVCTFLFPSSFILFVIVYYWSYAASSTSDVDE